MQTFDVLVVGKGNAALCAALAARDGGAAVAMLEAAAEEESGGNSRFAGGVMRFACGSVEDLKRLADIPDDEAKNTDWDNNTIEEFYDDLYRVTSYRTDPQLSEALVMPFNQAIKDGRGTAGIEPPKSNWAHPLDTPPFEAYGVTCGITFTFGGLRIAPETGQVLDSHLRAIPCLYAAGEMVGGLLYFNYPAGTGLVSGLVFGRIAGAGAAAAARAT